MLQFDFYNQTRQKISIKGIFSLLEKADHFLQKEKKIKKGRQISLELTLVNAAAMKKINRIFRGKNKPTDVISLSYFEKEMSDDFAGEIFICVPFAENQAKERGHSLNVELEFLFIHGLLHIFGYDHILPAERKIMERTAIKILAGGKSEF